MKLALCLDDPNGAIALGAAEASRFGVTAARTRLTTEYSDRSAQWREHYAQGVADYECNSQHTNGLSNETFALWK